MSANRVTQTRSLTPSPLPTPRKRIPEKRFENFQSSEPSRAESDRVEPSRAEPSRAEPRTLARAATYSFFSLFLSIPPPYTLPSLSRVAHPSLSTAYIRDRLALPLFFRRGEGRIYGQKRDQTDDGDKKREKSIPLPPSPPRSSTGLDDLQHSIVELERV